MSRKEVTAALQTWTDIVGQIYDSTDTAAADASLADKLNDLADLADPLMQRCVASEIGAEYAAEVTRIAYRGPGVSVETSQGILEADRVIVTIPLGVLKANTIVFDPPLPGPKRKAIDRLGFGLLDKVVLRFDQPFWQQDPDMIGFAGKDQPVPDVLNGLKFADKPLVVGLRGGANALGRESLSDQEAVREVVAALQGPEPTGVLVTRWAADPFARGSYSFLAVGSSPDDQRALAEPVSERLAFAGEATNEEYFATVHGAYLSGVREADRILG